jgi:hypothetical protein
MFFSIQFNLNIIKTPVHCEIKVFTIDYLNGWSCGQSIRETNHAHIIGILF